MFSDFNSRCASRGKRLQVFLLGVVDFQSALRLQKHLVWEVIDREDCSGKLLLCEHPPVLSIGREGSREELKCDPDELVSRRIEVRWIKRGGSALLHCPGQLAIYPILPLARLGIHPLHLRIKMELMLQRVAAEQRVVTSRSLGYPGISARGGVLGSIGMSIERGVTQHGAFLNVHPSMDWVRLTHPKGTDRWSSLSAERGSPIKMPSVRESVIRILAEQFEYESFHLFTGHPWLKTVPI